VVAAARPASQLKERFPAKAKEIAEAVEATALPVDQLAYLPLIARRSVWTVLLNGKTGEIRGFIPLDSF